MDPETARRNIRLGFALFVLELLIAGATVLTAYLYNQAN